MDLPTPRIEPTSIIPPALARRVCTSSPTWEALHHLCCFIKTVSFPCKCNKSESKSKSVSVVSDSLRPRGLYSSWNSPGQNTGVGSLSLLQGIFPTQGWNPGLPHCRRILYWLSHQGSPCNCNNHTSFNIINKYCFH